MGLPEVGILFGLRKVLGGVFSAIGAAVTWLLKNPLVLCLIVIGLLVLTVRHEHDGWLKAKAALVDSSTGKSWKAEEQRDAQALADARRDLATCQGNTAALSLALDRQSASLRAVAADGQRRAAASATALAAQRAAGAQASKAERAIEAATPGPDRCASALELIRSRP